jgi:hypothetical protein
MDKPAAELWQQLNDQIALSGGSMTVERHGLAARVARSFPQHFTLTHVGDNVRLGIMPNCQCQKCRQRPMTPDELSASLAGTNNGYLFAPTKAELDCARAYPDSFQVVAQNWPAYPWRILPRPIMQQVDDVAAALAGAAIAEILRLRRDPEQPDRYLTTWGNKTPLGIFRTLERMIDNTRAGDPL